MVDATLLPKDTTSVAIFFSTLQSEKAKKEFECNVPEPSKFLLALRHSARALESSSDEPSHHLLPLRTDPTGVASAPRSPL
jgi:hypothetical protein